MKVNFTVDEILYLTKVAGQQIPLNWPGEPVSVAYQKLQAAAVKVRAIKDLRDSAAKYESLAKTAREKATELEAKVDE